MGYGSGGGRTKWSNLEARGKLNIYMPKQTNGNDGALGCNEVQVW